MTYLALATDYDGTIATEGAVDAATLAALQRWRDAGRKLILVTGRMMQDWLALFPRYAPPDLFDWVVTENGAVLYHPPSQTTKLLAAKLPEAFVQELGQRVGQGEAIAVASGGEFAHLIQSGQLAPFTVGEIIVATWQPYDQVATELIQASGLDLQVILNKRAVMILPNRVDKAFGLQAALQELNLSPAQTVGVGDAENDLHLLELCGLGAAVANALPVVKAQADWVAKGERGAGVVELINTLLDGELEAR
jgi:HAD superfamily hydrolase (TIGR01484 family)